MSTSCPTEFICPITQEIMSDPVLISETGQTYERAAILDWWKRGHATCPATNTRLNTFQLSPNYVLKSLIQQYQASTSYAPAAASIAQPGSDRMYPSLQPQTHNAEPSQLQQILQRLSSPSMQIPSYRSGSSYSLWQLRGLVKDPQTHATVLHANVLPTLVALLLDESLPECQVNSAGILRCLSVRSPQNCEAMLKAGAVGALIQMLSASKAESRAAAAGCLCLLGWNSGKVKSEAIFSLCKAAKEQTQHISAILCLLPLLAKGDSAEQESAAACLHMLSESAPADVLATFELRDSSAAQYLCKLLDSGTPIGAFAAAETLRNLIQLPANRVEVMQQLLTLMESGCPAGQIDAANLCWQFCCSSSTTHNAHMTAFISSQTKLLPALSVILSSTDAGAKKSALGLVHVLALEVTKAQNSYADPVNVDTVRTQLTVHTPVLDAIMTTLQAPDAAAQVVAAYAVTNLAAFRSGVCPECDKSSPSFKQQPSRKRDFFRIGRLQEESDPSSPTKCRHTPRGRIADTGIVGKLYTLLDSSDAAVVSAVLAALYNISATQNLSDGVLQDKLLKLLGWNALSSKSKDAARMLLQRLDGRDGHAGLNFSFVSGFCLPPARQPIYLDP